LPWQLGKRRDAPVIALVHGLEGSSDSNYMRGIAEKAWAAGFHVVRLNQRNCGGTELLTPTLYNSGMSGDYRAVLEELAKGDGFEQIFFFAGYSMGRNLVTKMAGSRRELARQLREWCGVYLRWILAACADDLDRWTIIFNQGALCPWIVERYARKAELFPQRMRRMDLGRFETVREFDDAITAPSFGFKDAQAYYESAGARRSSGRFVCRFL